MKINNNGLLDSHHSAMSQFQLEQSSVIKTAPPGRQMEFSPKNEPLELAPLTANLQDLTKMQPMDYSQTIYQQMPTYTRNYEYNLGLGQTTQSSILSQQAAQQIYYHTMPVFSNQDWGRQQEVPLQYANYGQRIQYSTPDTSQQDRLYKGVDNLSPVDSGIGADLQMITPKEEFFDNSILDRTTERALSHRDSPVIIPKLDNHLGFQYILEAPISTSIRRDDDRMTYVNKGQFYTVSLEYTPDPCKPLKSVTVKSKLMVVFRDEKTYEDEMQTWRHWLQKQHIAKQRILEIDNKNSSGMIGQIEEIGHNGVQFYWNPSEQNCVKISVAVQCLSTDFSNQKGVKGLPLHIQVDTFDGDLEKVPFHRGYCQIKVFCDKGAERKLRDEDKRAVKRRQQDSGNLMAGGRKKSDGEYHESCERSDFYHHRDMEKPAAVFVLTPEMEISMTEGALGGYELDGVGMEPLAKRPRISERGESPNYIHGKYIEPIQVMLYVRTQNEATYTALHVIPPNVMGLAQAVANNFQIDVDKIHSLYKRCAKGVTVKFDDDMVKHYSNEDCFIWDIEQSPEDLTRISATLTEITQP